MYGISLKWIFPLWHSCRRDKWENVYDHFSQWLTNTLPTDCRQIVASLLTVGHLSAGTLVYSITKTVGHLWPSVGQQTANSQPQLEDRQLTNISSGSCSSLLPGKFGCQRIGIGPGCSCVTCWLYCVQNCPIYLLIWTLSRSITLVWTVWKITKWLCTHWYGILVWQYN